MLRNLAFFLLALLLGACTPKRTFKISAARQPSALLLCLVDQMQLWDSAHPIPQVLWAESGPDAFQIFSEGQADLTLANVSTFVPSLTSKPDTVILSEVYNSSRGIQVVVRQSQSLKSSRELAGKRIGYVDGTSAEIFLEYFLLTEGVNLGGVKKFSLELPLLQQAFYEGKIDAMVIWEPELSRFRKKYPGIPLTEFRSFVHESKGVLVGPSDADDKVKDLIDGVLKALIHAEKIYWEEADLAFVAYSQCMGDDTDISALRESLLDARGEVKITNSLRLNYERNREWLILRKSVTPALLPPFQNIIQPEYLRRIRSRGITLGGST